MITRILYNEEKDAYNSVVHHPVQTWEWGNFQISQGHKVYRLGVFDKSKIISAYTISFHKIPKMAQSVGTILRGPAIDSEMLANIKKIGLDEKAVFIKLEPDIYHKIYTDTSSQLLSPLPQFSDLVVSPKVAFYPYSYVVDLTKTENQLLESLHSKF